MFFVFFGAGVLLCFCTQLSIWLMKIGKKKPFFPTCTTAAQFCFSCSLVQVSSFMLFGAGVLLHVLLMILMFFGCNFPSSCPIVVPCALWCKSPPLCSLVHVFLSCSMVQVSSFVFFGASLVLNVSSACVLFHALWCKCSLSCSLVQVSSFMLLGAMVIVSLESIKKQ